MEKETVSLIIPCYNEQATLPAFYQELQSVLQTSPYHYQLLFIGVFFVDINFICLVFIQIHACFYFNYIIYYGLLIFCCQNVATHLL